MNVRTTSLNGVRLVCLLVVGAGGAVAQDFLSPKPMAPPAAVKVAPAKSAPVKTVAKPAQPPAPATAAQAPQAAPQAPRPDIAENIGDWRLQCFSQVGRACQLSQRLVNPTNQALIIMVELTRASKPKEATLLAVMLPLGLRINPNLALTSDNQPLASLPIVTCMQSGCVHTAELAPIGLDAMQKTQALKTEVTDMQGQRHALSLSMRGFNEAYLKTATYLRQN